MFDISEIIKCEKDIEWKYVGPIEKHRFSMAKHKMIECYEYLLKTRYAFNSDIENCIVNHKPLARCCFDDYANYITKFNNAYQVYVSCVVACKRGNI